MTDITYSAINSVHHRYCKAEHEQNRWVQTNHDSYTITVKERESEKANTAPLFFEKMNSDKLILFKEKDLNQTDLDFSRYRLVSSSLYKCL